MSCCPTTYWCGPDGPIAVEADSSGIFRRPTNATRGPYPTLSAAARACRGLVSVCQEDCPFSYYDPLIVTLENCTGDLIPGESSATIWGLDERPIEEQCGVGGVTGIIPTNFRTIPSVGLPSENPGLVFYPTFLASPGMTGGNIRETWLCWAQNQDIKTWQLRWITPGTGYSLFSAPPLLPEGFYIERFRDCGFTFYPEKTYLGRVQLYNDFSGSPPSIVYGEGDVYVQ